MQKQEFEMYIDEYSELIQERIFDRNAAVLAALFLEEVFGIFIDDREISVENLGSVKSIRRFLQTKLKPEDICAVSAE